MMPKTAIAEIGKKYTVYTEHYLDAAADYRQAPAVTVQAFQ